MSAASRFPSPLMGEVRVGVTRRFGSRPVLTRCHPHPWPFPHQRGKGA